MSYANGTTHYNLPLTTGSDKRDWADTNQAFTDVDAALYGAVQDTVQAEQDIDALETRMDTAEQNIATNSGDISGLDTRLTTAESAITSMSGQITDTRQDLEDMICAYNEATATSTHAYDVGDYFIYNDVLYKVTAPIGIGDTIVPDTNCSTTNVTVELQNKSSDSIICIFKETNTTASRPYNIDDYFILGGILYAVTQSISLGGTIIPNGNCVSTSVSTELTSLMNLKTRLLATITGDGIKTHADILSAFYQFITFNNDDRYIIERVSGSDNRMYFTLSNKTDYDGSVILTSQMGVSGSSLQIWCTLLKDSPSTSKMYQWTLSTTGNAVTDLSSNAPANTITFNLYRIS